jgi:hypothetical protein
MAGLVPAIHVLEQNVRPRRGSPGMTDDMSRAFAKAKPYTGKPFFFANSFSETCGRAPMCWITSAAARAPKRPAAS